MESVARCTCNGAPLSYQLSELPGQQCLGTVTAGLLGTGVDLHGYSRSSGYDGSQGEGWDESRLTGRVAWINHHGQVSPTGE